MEFLRTTGSFSSTQLLNSDLRRQTVHVEASTRFVGSGNRHSEALSQAPRVS